MGNPDSTFRLRISKYGSRSEAYVYEYTTNGITWNDVQIAVSPLDDGWWKLDDYIILNLNYATPPYEKWPTWESFEQFNKEQKAIVTVKNAELLLRRTEYATKQRERLEALNQSGRFSSGIGPNAQNIPKSNQPPDIMTGNDIYQADWDNDGIQIIDRTEPKSKIWKVITWTGFIIGIILLITLRLAHII